MDLVNYAVLVFDLTLDSGTLQGVDMTNTSIAFSQMSLTTSKLLYSDPNNTDTVVTNIIKSIK